MYGSQPAARHRAVAVPSPSTPGRETGSAGPGQAPPGSPDPTRGPGSGMAPRLGLVGLTFVSLGSIIGSGWLLGALTAARVAGPASLVAWALAGVLILGLALVHAELGASYPVAGGSARYTHLALGPLSGFVAGWLAWIQAVALAPIEAEAALSYLNNVWPGLISPQGTLTGKGLALGAAALGVCTVVNVLGVQRLADTNSVAVIWKFLVPVLTVITLMAVAFHPGNFHAGGGFAPFGAHGVFAALPAGVVFALQGFEQAVQMGAEARDPGRDVPRAVILATVLGTAVYLLLAIAFLGALSPAGIAGGWSHPVGNGDYGPYATIATGLGLGWLAVLLYIDAVVSPGGTALIYVGTSARLAYSMGQTGYLPRALRRLDRRGTPVVSILLAYAIGLVMFLPFPSWQQLVTLISSATFLTYAFAPVALMVLRKVDPDRPRPFRLPLAPLLARVAFTTSNLIVYWAGWENDQKLAVAIFAGLVCFTGYRATQPPGRWPPLEWRSALWIVPWLGGLTIISWLGQFGSGRGVIPFWVDLGVIVVFSLAVFELAIRVTPPAARSRALLETELA
ncbi:amino acid permease-associated region [Pseudofrankia inefficax]|uniref:Amino acid permease-associated region n=2 Tax=Pseudofrankia inefficax (strain DSM 45817 / CECT 9037 / DDB 130130 / EuI1c) TaxID=298654 RepID=E3JCG5_PSEI1|nr:amino acid permease-associated region [Pseudofrankia inefficax]